MKTVAKNICLVAVYAISLSCSIREDRGPCPGYLEIGLDSCIGLTGGVQLIGWNDSGTLFDKRSGISSEGGNTQSFAIPRGDVCYCAWFGLKSWKEDLHGLTYTIPLGRDSDPLYAFSRLGLFMEEEYLRDEAEPHRHHCVLSVHVSGLAPERMPELVVRISSSTSGICLEDMSPVRGTFQVTGHPGEDGNLRFTLLRQGFGDLAADIYDGGRLVGTYDLSSILDSLGYDWDAKDLSDITLSFSVSSAEVSLVIGPWDDGGSSDMSC